MTISLFPQSEKAAELGVRIAAFLRGRIEPAEPEYHRHIAQAGQRWSIPPVMERLKAQARAEGLWNLFLPAGPSSPSAASREPGLLPGGPSRPSVASGALGLLPGALGLLPIGTAFRYGSP